MTKETDVHGNSKDAAERLKKMKGDSAEAARPVPSGDSPANPWERAADRMMAAQADVVDARREAFTRLRLEDAHAANVRPFKAVGEPVDRHEASIAAERLAAHAATDVPAPEAADAPKREPVKYSVADERPVGDFEPATIEAARKRVPGDEEDA